MKTLLAIAALVVSVTATANVINANSSWTEIQASNDYIVKAGFSSLGAAGIFNACATATEIKSINNVKVCAETKFVPAHGRDGTPSEVCVRTEERAVSMPRSGVASVCQQYDQSHNSSNACLRYADEPYAIATTQTLEVIFAGRHYPNTAFRKNYTIPACN